MQPRPWVMLMVCTGNICRSPLAERLALARIAGALGPAGADRPPPDLLVGSAGVSAWAGEPMHPHSAAILRDRGADPTSFAARALTADLVAAADLVLCATRAHRSAVVGLAPRAMRRTFTLREFSRLTAGVDPADVPTDGVRAAGEFLTAAAWRARGAGDVAATALDDLTDPIDGDRSAFEGCARSVEDALLRPMTLLALGAGRPPAGGEPAGGEPAEREPAERERDVAAGRAGAGG